MTAHPPTWRWGRKWATGFLKVQSDPPPGGRQAMAWSDPPPPHTPGLPCGPWRHHAGPRPQPAGVVPRDGCHGGRLPATAAPRGVGRLRSVPRATCDAVMAAVVVHGKIQARSHCRHRGQVSGRHMAEVSADTVANGVVCLLPPTPRRQDRCPNQSNGE